MSILLAVVCVITILCEVKRQRLDMPITLEELDKALDKANMASAPGIDGVSNKMI